jgi:hypothetical protein
MKHGARIGSLATSAMLLVSAWACSSNNAPQSDAAVLDGSGGAIAGGGGAGGARAIGTQKPLSDAGFACGEGPDDVSVACTDGGSGMHAGGGAGGTPAPTPDAHVPDEPDAALSLDAGSDASMPPVTADEGLCAARDTSCTFGQARTNVASATCTITGDFLSVTRDYCEVCSKSTDAYDFILTVMDCGSSACVPTYSEGGEFGGALGAGVCETRTDTAGLSGTLANDSCIDVYAYIGSGVRNFGNWMLQTSDQVRVCQCDRTTDTCITCTNGACDP